MENTNSKKQKILILEDNSDTLVALGVVATKQDFFPVCCSTLEDAKKELQQGSGQFLFVILDQELSTSQDNSPKSGADFHKDVMQARIPTFIYSGLDDHCPASLFKEHYKKSDHKPSQLFDKIKERLEFLDAFIETWRKGGEIDKILDALFADANFAEFVNEFDSKPNWETQHVVRKIANQLIYLADHKMIDEPNSTASNTKPAKNPKLPLSDYHVSEQYIADLRHSNSLWESLQSKATSDDESKIPVVTGAICWHKPKEGNPSLFVVLTPLCDFANGKADNIILAEIFEGSNMKGDRYIPIANPPIRHMEKECYIDLQTLRSVPHAQFEPNEEAAQARQAKEQNGEVYYPAGVVIAPTYLKEIVSKLGRYLGRQGAP